jgi:hypothetical protein
MNRQKLAGAKVQIAKNGPYIVSGDVPLSREIVAYVGILVLQYLWGWRIAYPT